MEKYAWKGRIVDGMLDEYIRRHDEIWPEMKALLKQGGNRKGLFTRDRKPKMAAHYFRRRWDHFEK